MFEDLDALSTDSWNDFQPTVMKKENIQDFFFDSTPNTSDISIQNVDLQDFHGIESYKSQLGHEVESHRISNPILKLTSPMTLEFRDSFYGRCCAFFTASDIVSITRQGDRNGIFIQLSKPLRLDTNKEHSLTMAMFIVS